MEGNASGGGIGFLGLLTIVFIVLKLIGKIDWSWWLVLSPTWISFAIFLLFAIPLWFIAGKIQRMKER